MKRALTSLALAVTLVTLAGSGVAFVALATTQVKKMKHLTGADETAKMVTVKRTVKRKEHEDTAKRRAIDWLIFAVDTAGVAMLSRLRPGERVRVSYVEADGKLTAASIAAAVPTAKHAETFTEPERGNAVTRCAP